MTDHTDSTAGAAPAPMSLVARFIGVITSPKATFQSVVAHPKWLGMLALTTVLMARLRRAADDDAEAARRRRSTPGRQMEASG